MLRKIFRGWVGEGVICTNNCAKISRPTVGIIEEVSAGTASVIHGHSPGLCASLLIKNLVKVNYDLNERQTVEKCQMIKSLAYKTVESRSRLP